ncbi:DNA-binding MarR family transcriptional regulator [Streptomyces sp. PsTaAH-137]|nr:DNA-binding MarR family transcriptional regulator [Streptomyces sp. PsTaAH-137]
MGRVKEVGARRAKKGRGGRGSAQSLIISIADYQNQDTLCGMTDDPFFAAPLTHRLGYLVKHAFHQLSGMLAEALEPYGVNPREVGVLSVIAADGEERSQHELAQLVGVDRTTMVALIDALEGKGLVERRRSAVDRRRNVVALTPAGVACQRDADRARIEAERAYLAPLDEQSAAALTETLRTLYLAHAGR